MLTSRITHAPAAIISRRNAANWVTGGRIVLLFLAAAFAAADRPLLAILAIPLGLSALLMDWLDGVVARRCGCESKAGGVLDIAGDRIAENVWWVVFAWLRLIPLWIPVIVISRGFLTDAFRSYALSRGHTAFGRDTMMRSRIGYLLVASRVSRASYGAAKFLVFGLLFTLNAVGQIAGTADVLYSILEPAAVAVACFTVVFCLVRGAPVAVAFKRLIREEGGAS